MGLASESTEVIGSGSVWFSLVERPDVRYEFTSDDQGPASLMVVHASDEPAIRCIDPVSMALVSATEGERTSGRFSTVSSREGLRDEGVLPPTSYGDSNTVSSARAHLVNFVDPNTFTDCALDVPPWRVTIRSLANSKPLLQSFVATQVIDLARSDGRSFAFSDAQSAFEAIADALTFAVGRVVGVALPQGFDGDEAVRLEWLCTITHPWRNTQPWWDCRYHATDQLEELIRRWVQAGDDGATAQVLRRAARIYASAQTESTLDVAIPIAGIGWELMAWDALRRREQLVSADEFDRQMPAATALRLALRLGGIPTALPGTLPSLEPHARREPKDGPAALVEVRNRLTHPPRENRGWPDSDGMLDAKALALEYVALLTLASIEYRGTYTPLPGRKGWPGADQPVPWAAHEPSAAQA